jgi:hypothetical protein
MHTPEENNGKSPLIVKLNLCKLPKRESEEQKEEAKKGFDMQSYVQEIYQQ